MLPVVVLRAARCMPGADGARPSADAAGGAAAGGAVYAGRGWCATGSGRLEKLRVKEAMTRGALPHGGGGRRFAFGGRFECSCVAAFAPAAAGASPRPPLAPWVRVCSGSAARKRFECPKDTRNAARRTQRRIPPGRALRTSRQEVRRARGPSELKSESSDMRGGFGSLAQARLPYAGRRPASRRQSRRRSGRPAHPPAEKIGASRAFPTRSTAS